MLAVKKNIPTPKASRLAPAPRRKYPFDDMEVGDMFFVPEKTKNTLTTHVSTVGKKLGMKFTTRLITMRRVRDDWELCEADHPDAVTGIGVWRAQ